MYEPPHSTRFRNTLLPLQAGFSLIELVIVIALLGILAGAVSVNYTKTTRRQNVKQESLNVKQNLRLIQSKAKSGDRGNCAASTPLYGWRAQFTAATSTDPATIHYQPSCGDDDDNAVTTPITEQNLKTGITFGVPLPDSIFFRPLNLPVENAPQQILITNGEYHCTISVDLNGEISDEGCET